MIHEATLSKIYINKEKDGKAMISKNGRRYAMVVIENPDGKRASMYCDMERDDWKLRQAEGWKEGQKVWLDFEQDGEYLNFRIPSKNELQLMNHEQRIKALEEAVKGVETFVSDVHNVSEDVDPEEMPW